MRILSISSLFPVPLLPNHGVFVENRLAALSRYVPHDIAVFCPIAQSWLHSLFDKYASHVNAPDVVDTPGKGLIVHYPRFFSVPGALKWIEKASALRQVVSYIERSVDVSEFDVIDVHWGFPDLLIANELSQMYDKPIVFTLRGMETFYRGDAREHYVKSVLQNVSGIVSLSNEMREHVMSLGYSGPVSVIPNGSDTNTFRYSPQQESRAKLGLASDKKYLLAVGSLIKRKGFDLLISALAHLPNHVNLIIVGKSGLEGDFESGLINLVSSLSLDERVHFAGPKPQTDLAVYYNAVDAFCLSSYGEGSPNVLVEAASSGCPVYAHDVGESSPVVAAAVSGALLPNPNTRTESEQIQSWVSVLNEALLVDIDGRSRSNQSLYFRQFDWNWCAGETFDFLSRVLSGETGK